MHGHLDPLRVGSIHPTAENASARKNKHMRAIMVDDGKLEITIERCGRDRLPHAAMDAWTTDGVFDLDHSAAREVPLRDNLTGSPGNSHMDSLIRSAPLASRVDAGDRAIC